MSIGETTIPYMIVIIAVLAIAVLVVAGALRRRGGRLARAARACQWVTNASLVGEAAVFGYVMYEMSQAADPLAAAGARQVPKARALSLGLNAGAVEIALLALVLVALAAITLATRRRVTT